MAGKNRIKRESHGGFCVEVEVCLYVDEGHHIAHCPALDISSYGETPEEAKNMFNEAVRVFFEEVVSRGTLNDILLDLGWTLSRKPEINYQPPQLSGNHRFQEFCSHGDHFSTKLTLPID